MKVRRDRTGNTRRKVAGDDLKRVQERLADTQRTPLHIAFQRECVVAIIHCEITIFEVVMDVLAGERVKRQDAITYLGLLLRRKVRHDKPIADVDTKLVTASTP